MHVLTHVYRSHWQHLVELQLHPHFNTLVYHVMLFSKQFKLVDARDSDLLEDLFQRLRQHHNAVSSLSESITSTCEVIASDTQLPDVDSQQPADVDQNCTELTS